jgi:hypothetical protein
MHALQWAWNDSDTFMVLNEGAENLDQTGGEKVESVSM